VKDLDNVALLISSSILGAEAPEWSLMGSYPRPEGRGKRKERKRGGKRSKGPI